MGRIQALEPTVRKVGVRPTLSARKVLAVPPMPFQEQSAQTAADQAVVFAKHAPVAVTEIVEPALRRAIDSRDHDFQRFTRFAGSQLAKAIHDLPVALLPGQEKVPGSFL